MTLQLTPQWVKPVTGQVEVPRVPRFIEVGQDVADAVELIGPHPARIIALEQAFQSLVAKRPQHKDTVPRIGTRVNFCPTVMLPKPAT